MGKSLKVMLSLVAAILLATQVVACGSLWSKTTKLDLKYRLEISYQLGNDTYSASGVLQIIYQFSHAMGLNGLTQEWRGEAVGIEMPAIGLVYALGSNPPGAGQLIPTACGLGSVGEYGSEDAWLAELDKRFSTSCDVPAKRWPIIAITRQPSDPRAMHLFAADALPDALKITAVRVTRTADTVTFGTTDRLPWIRTHPFPSIGQGVTYNGTTGYYYIAPWLFIQEKELDPR